VWFKRPLVKSLSLALQAKAKKIRLLLLDVDGVLTDGGIYLDDRGVESKRFDVRDGQGIALLQRAGLQVGFITGRSSDVVRYRARELNVEILHQGIANKAAVYEQIKSSMGLRDEQIAYAGDDIGDLPVLRRAGFAITVRASSVPPQSVDYVTRATGGHGAVREITDLLLSASGALKTLTKEIFAR
jgi:3-deoxy-D-manno-octulosonate 8-phosphate phosphatase (KDO 8-P phosphatase)